MAIARRLTLGPDVTRAAAYHVVDAQFVARHSALSWAAHIGPIVGLDIDDPGPPGDVMKPPLLDRLLGRHSGETGREKG